MNILVQLNELGEPNGVEEYNVIDLVKHREHQHSYKGVTIDELNSIKDENKYSDYIPVGNIPFVRKWLSLNGHNTDMKPIEVPQVLRKERYLGREYKIVKGDELPDKGMYFIKDASELKKFSYTGIISWLVTENESIDKHRDYVISSIVDIVSEYRVFVCREEIEAIQFYDGDCIVFPDVNMIKEMVNIYSLEDNRPKSYTMDIAVIKNNIGEEQTVILEVHPVTSVGTYGFDSSALLYMYRDGIEWYKGNN